MRALKFSLCSTSSHHLSHIGTQVLQLQCLPRTLFASAARRVSVLSHPRSKIMFTTITTTSCSLRAIHEVTSGNPSVEQKRGTQICARGSVGDISFSIRLVHSIEFASHSQSCFPQFHRFAIFFAVQMLTTYASLVGLVWSLLA